MDDDSLLNDFISESRDHLQTIERELMALEGGGNPELVNRLFRAMHSMKGGAGFLALTAINAVAHRSETLLDQVRSGRMTPTRPMIDLLLEAGDAIAGLVEQGRAGADADVSDLCARLEAVMAAEGKALGPKAIAGPSTVFQGPAPWCAEVRLADAGLAKRDNDHPFVMAVRFDGTVPPDSTTTTNLTASGHLLLTQATNDGGWLVVLATPMPAEILESLFSRPPGQVLELSQVAVTAPVAAVTPKSTTTVAPPAAQPTTESHPKPVTESRQKTEPAHAATDDANNTVRVHVAILDQLMNLAGELVLVRNQQLLLNAAVTSPEARAQVQRLDAITTSLQEAIMRTRLQPIGTLFSRFPRVIRDLSTKLGKKIQLVAVGNEVELDRTILESLTDPLKHLLRNACDHGMEMPERRIAAGKPESGTVRMSAWHEGGQVNIEISDDGPGIDPRRITKKALENGLKTAAEIEALTEKEILRLILLPGFSTAEAVTDVSGRGVGMDVVATAIESLGGSLEIRSRLGEGSTFHLRLPLTLAILPSLIVACGNERFAIPQANVEELVGLDEEEAKTRIESAGDQEVYRLRGHLLPLVRLSEVLRHPRPFTAADRAAIARQHRGRSGATTFAVVRFGSTPFGLIVDEVIGTEEIVVKPMHAALKKVACYAGATVMGDGSVALILAVEGLATHAGVDPDRHEAATETETQDKESQTLLLFAGGQDERFAVSLPLIRRVERIAIADIQRIGDREFIPVDGVATSIIRLNAHLPVTPICQGGGEGFLLLPKHISRPVGLLAERIVDTINTSVALSTDTFASPFLLGTALIDGRMTLFPDLYRLALGGGEEETTKRRARILAVDDTAFFRQLVKGYLEGLGHDVSIATDGEEALAMLAKQSFDLVVSDLEMPRCDGWELARRIRQDLRLTLPVLAMSTLGDGKSVQKALDAGFDRYEQKMDPPRFTAAVKDLLAGARTTLVNGKEVPRG